MKYQLRAVCAAIALLGGSFAASAQEVQNETPNRWFVELASPPTADGGRLSTTRAEKAAFRKAARAAKLDYEERYAYDTLFNGFSVEIAPNDLGKLSRIAGIKALYPVFTETLAPFDPDNSADLATALGQSGADVAQNDLGLTGAGIKVGVIDSGIDFDHPDFGGDGIGSDGINPDPDFGINGNSRVKYGYDFVGDAYNGGNAPAPDSNPDSCRDFNGDAGSHGTHVAGIVGASGTPPTGARGVAPDVTLGAYRVFGCNGSTSTDIMAAAMERALADGMDVVNMSIGSSYQWPQYPSAAAATRLVNQGVSVVASIGNSAATTATSDGGAYTAGAPGTGAKVIGVASFDNTTAQQKAFSVNATLYGYNQATASPPAPISGGGPLALVGAPLDAAAACAALPAGSLTGQIALIRRGTCGFNLKAFNAQNAGAIAVVLYNNAAGELNATVAGPPQITIPVVGVTAASGAAIIAVLPNSLTWTSQTISSPLSTAGLISSFSSWGMAADLSLKPDIGAPGGSIRSTYPIEYGSYATISGTSMSSPHVAGAVALLLQAHPNTPTNAIRDILQNSADPHLWFGNPSLGFIDSAHRQGAGMLDVPGSVLATTRVEPGKLSLGETEFGPVQRSLTVTNNGSSSETYDLSSTAGIATLGIYNNLSFFNAPSTVDFSQGGNPVTSVTVPAGGSASFDVTVTPNLSLADLSQFGGYIVIDPQSGADPVRVPFAGFKGDYQAIQVLVPTANGFPWLAKNGFNQPGGATFNLTSAAETPNIFAHFEHQSRRVRFEIFGTDGKAWHRAFPDFEYFGKNTRKTTIFGFAWDGTTVNGKKINVVPDGTYVIKMSVLKALGDDSNAAHWETFTSPVVTIDRP